MTHRSLALLCAACLTGCGDLEVRSVPPERTASAALSGVWSGSWQSDRNGDSGAVAIRVQDFRGEPVVAFSIDNPCLQPRPYELVVVGPTIELRDDGVTVLAATLAGEDELVGTYGCDEDDGSWQVVRTGELPEPIDLSGTWAGSVFAPGISAQPIELALDQSVQAGRLALLGEATLPGVLPFPLPVVGVVQFEGEEFQLALETAPGFQPVLRMNGFGDREPLAVPFGTVEVIGTTPLPFSQGLLALEPQSPPPQPPQ